jgi:hypothetical protein
VAALLLGLLALLAAAPQVVTRRDPASCRLSDSLRPPSWQHPFGFDLQGCDQLAQTVHGARTSLGVAVLTITGTVLVALVVGSLGGFVGGRTDTVLARITDVWAGIPLVLGGVLLLSGTERRGVLELTAVLVLFGWPPMVRVLRAGVVQQRDRDHVVAARALGRPAAARARAARAARQRAPARRARERLRGRGGGGRGDAHVRRGGARPPRAELGRPAVRGAGPARAGTAPARPRRVRRGGGGGLRAAGRGAARQGVDAL